MEVLTPTVLAGGGGGGGGSGTPGGADTQIQYNSSGTFAGSADLTWDDTAKELGVGGDINLDDGGTYATTLQLITPTANRTISFPDATGTVALVGGSSGQLVYNNAGAYAGAPSTSVGGTGNITLSLAGAPSTPPVSLTGTWFSGGTSTTTKPQLLIEPNGTTSTAWSTSGTGLGVNAASGFGGNLLDLQVNGTSRVVATSAGLVGIGTSSPSTLLTLSEDQGTTITLRRNNSVAVADDLIGKLDFFNNDGSFPGARVTATVGAYAQATAGGTYLAFSTATNGSSNEERLRIDSSGRVGIGTASPGAILHTVNTSAGAATVGAFIQNSSLTVGTEVRLGFAPNSNLVSDNRYSWIGAVNDTGSNGSSLTFATTPGGQGATEKMRLDGSGRLLVGTSSDSGGALLQVNGDRIRVATAKTPASASDTGTTGEICWDANYIYVCTATNTWKRTALSTW